MKGFSFNRFNSIAANYASSEVHANSPTIERLKGYLNPEIKLDICDIAAGAGHLTFALVPFAKKIVCVDPAPNMLKIIKERSAAKNIEISTIESTIEDLNLESGSCGLVMSRLAAHHFKNINTAIDKMVKIAKKGGKIAIIDLVGNQDPYLDEINHKLELLHDPTHGRSYAPAVWKELFARPDLKMLHFNENNFESPNGISIDTWCEVGASGEDAKFEIKKLLSSQTYENLKKLGFSSKDGVFYYHAQTIFILAEKI